MEQKKWKKPLIVAAVIFMFLLLCSTFFLYAQNKNLTKRNKNLQREIGSTSQAVYIAIRDIDKGETIKGDGLDANVELQPILTGLEIENYITEDDLGSTATVDITEGIPVLINMIADKDIALSQDLREYEIENIDFISSQSNYDMVDIRIYFPDGSDYIVLAKKQIQKLDEKEKKCTVFLNEEEIMRYKCATADAEMNGGILYTTNYVEDSLQKSAVANYPIRENIRAILKGNPNATTKTHETFNVAERRNLEKRFAEISNITAVREKEKFISLAGLVIAGLLIVVFVLRNVNRKASEPRWSEKTDKKERKQKKTKSKLSTSVTKDYMEYANQIIHGSTVVKQCEEFYGDTIAIHIVNRNGEIWINYFDELAKADIEESINETILSSLSIESEEGNYIRPEDRFFCTIKRNEKDMITYLEFKIQETEVNEEKTL